MGEKNISMKYSEFMNMSFQQALVKVAQGQYHQKAAYGISRFIKLAEAKRKEIQDEFSALVKKFAKLDEKGAFIHPENNPNQFDIPDEKADEYKAALEAFEAQELTIDRWKMPTDWISELKFSPAEINALDHIFDFASDWPAEKADNVHPMKAVE